MGNPGQYTAAWLTRRVGMSCGEYEGSQIQYDFVLEENVMVAMRDGTRLATDVYRPAL